jgi:hypothetical protein
MSQTVAEKWTLAEQVYNRLVNIQLVPENGAEPRMAIPAARRDEEVENRKKAWDESRKAHWAEGEKNRRHYLDISAKSGQPWHRAAKQGLQYSEFILLTPEMARVLLAHNPRNRTLKTSTLGAYKRDIIADRWLQTDEAIGIDVNGNLYNGQHRCTAVAETGKAVVFYFTFNVPVEAKFVVDSGVKRSTNEKLSYIIDHHMSTRLAAVARSMLRGISVARFKFSDSEIGEFAMKYKEDIEWVNKVMPKVRSDAQAAILKCALKHGRDKILPFCERYQALDFQTPNSPIAALYKFLAKTKGDSGTTIYRKTLTAVNGFLDDKNVQKLHATDVDVFEFNENMEIVNVVEE